MESLGGGGGSPDAAQLLCQSSQKGKCKRTVVCLSGIIFFLSIY